MITLHIQMEGPLNDLKYTCTLCYNNSVVLGHVLVCSIDDEQRILVTHTTSRLSPTAQQKGPLVCRRAFLFARQRHVCIKKSKVYNSWLISITKNWAHKSLECEPVMPDLMRTHVSCDPVCTPACICH